MKKHSVLACALIMLISQAASAEDLGLNFNLDKLLGTTYYGVYINGKKSGYACDNSTKTTYNGRPAYKVALDMNTTFSVIGNTQEMNVFESRTFYATGELAECVLKMGPNSYKGVAKDGKITITAQVGGEEKARTIDAPDLTLKDYSGAFLLVFDDAEVGDSVKGKDFSPMLGQVLNATFTVRQKTKQMFDDQEMTVFKIEMDLQEMMGPPSFLYVREDGFIAKQIMPTGMLTLELRAEDEETAKNQEVESVEMLDATMVRPTGEPLKTGCKKLRLRLTDLAEAEAIADNDRQHLTKMEDGSYELTITRDTFPAKIAQLPIKGEEFAQYLEPTEIYQSANPEIVETARKIAGGDTNSARVAQKICLWVFTNIEKTGTAELSNALDTLRSGSGDCSEHAVLFVALCRAVGLPARELTGLGYSESFGAFGGHAWGEVYVGDWIAVDPTFGEPIASCGHIQMGDGSRLSTVSVLRTLGTLKIEVLECK